MSILQTLRDNGYSVGEIKEFACRVAKEKDDAFWIRQYAGMAMQGILANPDIMQHVCGSWFKTDVSVTMWAANQAKALLEEVKKHETANQMP